MPWLYVQQRPMMRKASPRCGTIPGTRRMRPIPILMLWRGEGSGGSGNEVRARLSRPMWRYGIGELLHSSHGITTNWEHLFVNWEEYGRGTADRLLAAAEGAIAQDGVKQAYLYCRVTNARALHFYEKRGWSKNAEITEQLICANGTRPSKVWRMIKPLR
jgi:GNAT superfamily N-acetyltransferase